MDTMDTLDTAKYARIVGVFRDRAKADQAVESLKQAGMSDVELMVYDPQAAGVVETSVDTSAVETATRLATASWRKGGSRMPSVSWPTVGRTTLISLPALCLSTVPSLGRMKTALIVLQKNRLVTLLLKASLEQRKHQVMRMLSA